MTDQFMQIIQDYQENHRRYNQNIQQMLDILENRNQRYPEPVRPTRNTNRTTINHLMNNFLRYYGNTHQHQNYEDVIVHPTRAQIDQATELILYDNSMIHSQCAITLEPFEEGEEICRIRHCFHCFKKTAIMDWFRRNVRCPVCRYDIRDYRADQSLPIVTEEPDESGETEESPSRTRPMINTIQNSIRALLSTISIPSTDIGSNDQLVYTFDFPIRLDASGNFRI